MYRPYYLKANTKCPQRSECSLMAPALHCVLRKASRRCYPPFSKKYCRRSLFFSGSANTAWSNHFGTVNCPSAEFKFQIVNDSCVTCRYGFLLEHRSNLAQILLFKLKHLLDSFSPDQGHIRYRL